MYFGVPQKVFVVDPAFSHLDSPKSVSWAFPSESSRTFEGFRSR